MFILHESPPPPPPPRAIDVWQASTANSAWWVLDSQKRANPLELSAILLGGIGGLMALYASCRQTLWRWRLKQRVRACSKKKNLTRNRARKSKSTVKLLAGRRGAKMEVDSRTSQRQCDTNSCGQVDCAEQLHAFKAVEANWPKATGRSKEKEDEGKPDSEAAADPRYRRMLGVAAADGKVEHVVAEEDDMSQENSDSDLDGDANSEEAYEEEGEEDDNGEGEEDDDDETDSDDEREANDAHSAVSTTPCTFCSRRPLTTCKPTPKHVERGCVFAVNAAQQLARPRFARANMSKSRYRVIDVQDPREGGAQPTSCPRPGGSAWHTQRAHTLSNQPVGSASEKKTEHRRVCTMD